MDWELEPINGRVDVEIIDTGHWREDLAHYWGEVSMFMITYCPDADHFRTGLPTILGFWNQDGYELYAPYLAARLHPEYTDLKDKAGSLCNGVITSLQAAMTLIEQAWQQCQQVVE
jgi:hypothetical protein